VHGLHVHAVLLRKVRSPEERENIEVMIISIRCTTAQEAGKQYTKRVLPPFVIPYCQINRQGVMAYLARFPDGRVEYGAGLRMLGALDIRTIRHHVALGRATVAAAALELAGLLSSLPAHATLPDSPVTGSPGHYLEELAHQMHRAARRAGRAARSPTPGIVYAHLVSVRKRSVSPLETSLTSVLRAAVFHDTS
jgi:hypothetical protein